jgi:hypothetical protein
VRSEERGGEKKERREREKRKSARFTVKPFFHVSFIQDLLLNLDFVVLHL